LISLLHTADWQIGTQFGQFEPEHAALLGDARFETVRRIAALATEREVDAVLVAGDVFDQQTVSSTVIRKLFAALAGFNGRWFLLPGNHDSALTDSVWTHAQRLNCIPANVRVILEQDVVLLDELKLALICAPLTQRNTYEDTTAFFDGAVTPDGYCRVGIAHGSVTGPLQELVDATNPIAADRVTTAKLDYLALGDWHGVKSVNARTWYAGTHEQDRFKDNSPGHVLHVKLRQPGAEPEVQPVRVGRYSWHRWAEMITLPTDVDELARKLATLGQDDVLRIGLTGTAALAQAEAVNTALDIARGTVRALRVDTSLLRVLPSEEELSALAGQGGYVGKVVDRLQALQADAQQSCLASQALLLLAKYQREMGTTA
jgi:DNA repair exonuclease SbcCD nuclease subunit